MPTREPQYQCLLDVAAQEGLVRLGLTANEAYVRDPRRLVFNLARYKFVSKILSGKKSAVEIGCGDGFGARIVRQEVPEVVGLDFDPVFIRAARENSLKSLPMSFFVHDILSGPAPGPIYQAAYSLDVIEHIRPEDEYLFLRNVGRSIPPKGVFVVGTPSVESQSYASPQSRQGHVNCKSGEVLKKTLLGYFDNVFLFSMNDEVVHTGFLPMAHYLMAVCVGPRFWEER